MFSLSRYAPWARNIARIAANKHRCNFNQLKPGAIVASASALPYVRSFAGEYNTPIKG